MNQKRIYNILITLWLVLSFGLVQAQKVKDVKFSISPDQTKITVNYAISPVSDEMKYITSLWLSTDGGSNFIGPLKNVTGDIGVLKIMPTGTLKVEWDIYKDVDDLVGKIVFQVRLETEKLPVTPVKFICYQFSNKMPVGFMYGYRKYNGFYTKIQTNLTFVKGSYEADANGITNFNSSNYWIIGNQEKYSNLMLSAGYLHKVSPYVFAYGGGGFGLHNRYWNYTSYNALDEVQENGYARVKENSAIGLQTEVGAVFFLQNKVALTMGLQNINFKYFNISVGAGIKLK